MRQYKYKIKGNDYDVTINGINGDMAQVEVNGIAFEVEMLSSTLSENDLPEAAAKEATAVAPAPKKEEEAAPAATGQVGEGTPVKAPLPGVIRSINVKVGQAVKKGDTLLVLEAMKMENNINVEQDGTVTSIVVAVGNSVMEGDVMVTIA